MRLLFIFWFLFISGCANKQINSIEAETRVRDIESNFNNVGYQKAVVTDLRGLDGCSFVIQLESGEKLEPTNLMEEFKIDRLPVWIKYKISNGVSICMVGKIINIIDIKKRDN